MLSIIIPTLNEENFLPKLLGSIKSQDFNDYEIIVADAGSKDKTVEISKENGCRVVKGGLLPAGRNRGAEAANGDIFLFLDSDVILSQHFLKHSVEQFKKRGLGIAGFSLIPLSNKKIDKFFHNIFNIWTELTQKISPHAASTIMCAKEVHNAIKGFDEEIVFIEDYAYSRAAAKASKYGLIKEPVSVSVRRYEKDGRLKTYIKYTLGELHTVFLGPIKSNIFNYKFGHYDADDKKT